MREEVTSKSTGKRITCCLYSNPLLQPHPLSPLPFLDLLQPDPVMRQEPVVDLLEGHVDGGPAAFQVKRRVQVGGHQHPDVVVPILVARDLLESGEMGAPRQEYQDDELSVHCDRIYIVL